MYTLIELQSKTFGALKKIGDDLNVLPKGDRRYRQSWIDAIVGVNPPLLQLLEVSPGVEVDQVQKPIIETVEVSPGVKVEPAQEAPLESKFGRIVYPRPFQEAIAQAAENTPGVEVDQVSEAIGPATEIHTDSGEFNGKTTEADGRTTETHRLRYTRTHLRYQQLDAASTFGGSGGVESTIAKHRESDLVLAAAGNDQRNWRQALRSRSNELATETSPGVESLPTKEAQKHKLLLCLKDGENTLWYDGKDFVLEKWSAKTYCKRGVATAKHQLRFHPTVKRVFQSWGNVLQVVENSLRVDPIEVLVQEPIAQAAEKSLDVDRTQKPVMEMVQASPGVDPDDELPECTNCFGDRYVEDEFGVVKFCQCDRTGHKKTQRAIVPVAKTSPGVEVDRVEEQIVPVKNFPGSRSKTSIAHQLLELFQSTAHIIEDSPGVKTEATVSESVIAPAARNRIEEGSDQNPILTGLVLSDRFLARYSPPQVEIVHFQSDADGQLSLLDFEVKSVNEPPEPDDYEGDMFAFQAAYDRWMLTSELHEIIHTKNSPGVTQAPEPTQNATTRLEIPRNESVDVRYVRSHPAQPDGNYSNTETVGQGNQEGDRVLEVAGNFQADRGRVIPHQPTQLSPHDNHIKPPGRGDGRVDLGLEIGMLVGRRRDRYHLGKILAIYKSRRGIWRAKIQPLNKSNFVYFDCAALLEQRLLYDYELKPGGFLSSGSTFDKTRGEKFEVYSRKVRSPKPTNWTAGELSSLSTFKLKQIARDIEIPSIPGTAGKRSLIRAILAEQAISQEKAAAQRERETGRAIVQKQKSGLTTRKKRASAPLGTQLSLLNVAV